MTGVHSWPKDIVAAVDRRTDVVPGWARTRHDWGLRLRQGSSLAASSLCRTQPVGGWETHGGVGVSGGHNPKACALSLVTPQVRLSVTLPRTSRPRSSVGTECRQLESRRRIATLSPSI